MKTLFQVVLLLATISCAHAQSCSSCGSTANDSFGDHTGPALHISMGALQYGQSAGTLYFSTAQPNVALFTPAGLQFDSPSGSVIVVTNVDGSLRQVNAPQALADIPLATNGLGYSINFYYTSQIGTTNPDGTFQLTGSPYATWTVTNLNASTIYQAQISEYTSGGLLKQWTYNYSTNTGGWTVQSLGGVQETMAMTNLSTNLYQVCNILQYSNGPVAKEVIKTYQSFSWGVAPVQIAEGTTNNPEITQYSYYDPAPYSSGFLRPVQTITYPDGSWQWNAGYDANGNLTNVYSSFGDITLAYATNNSGGGARQTIYTFDPTNAGVSGSGDNGTYDATTARRTVVFEQGQEVFRSYTVFPASNERLDIQCTVAGAAWNAAGNLITTNWFYTNGPNQYAIQSMCHPDGTITTYNYVTNSTCETNIVVTGAPDPTGSYVVDGVSNVMVLNNYGYCVASTRFDVMSGLSLADDVYSNYDSYGRPQQVTHLDGTTEYMYYACCGLNNTIDKDGVNTVYLYDSDQRQIGYEKFYNSGTSNGITFENTLDAAGRTVQTYRIGSDDSVVMQSQMAYDPSGELIFQTNALGGVTTYTWTNNSITGAWIRTTVNPDGGIVTNLYYADGSLKMTVGTAVHGKAYGYGYGMDAASRTGTYEVETNLDNNGNLTTEWTKTFTDMAGRITETLYADGHYSESFYNSAGQRASSIDPDGVSTLYEYNAKGALAYRAMDMNQNGVIDFSGNDRITQTTNDVTTDHGTTVSRSRTFVWLDGQSTGTLVSYTENSADGLNMWQTQYRDTSTPVTSHSQTVSGTSRTVTSTAPDGSYVVNDYSYGRMISGTQYDSTSAQIGGTTYGYDSQGRQNTLTDARNGTSTNGFNNADQVATNTTPSPGGGDSPEITITTYDNMQRPASITQPDGNVVYSAYLLTGELGLQYGSRTYPVGYSYDYAGRMKTMTNWSGFSTLTGARVTTWNYDGERGWLTNKAYADSHGPGYSYTPAGRLAIRAWVRGVTTSYAYDMAGGLTNVVYSGSTPQVGYAYDRLGRQTSILCNGMTDTKTYDLADDFLAESFSGGVLSGLTVTNQYDTCLRRTNLAVLNSSTVLASTAYGYDAASRLAAVSDGTNSATYSYLANSPLVSQIVFANNGSARMTTTKQYDYLNRLTQISSTPSAAYAQPLTYNYNYNSANQRTKDTLADGSYWVYGYDSLGQVTNGCKFFSDGTPVAGQQFDYTFDTIGNRTQAQAGGDTNGLNLRVANYTNNILNQITSRDMPGYVDVIGASILTNAVTVNGQIAYRKQEYFRQQLAANNSSSALWTNITVSGGQSVTGNVYVAQQPETFKYDADGNLTNDGRWAYVWDGENRLITMTNNTGVGPQYTLNFAYDSQGRRIQKLVTTNGVGVYTNNFVYDGWNLAAILNPQYSIISSFMWGSDLSGSLKGAGGVGGLLEVSYHGASTMNCFPAFDGNGNLMALINASVGTLAANYDYGPFGEVIRVTESMAKVNPMRFSTKFDDDESDLIYYGYRYYNPVTGKWTGRDPVGELGGLNIYSSANNDCVNHIDRIGLQTNNQQAQPSCSFCHVNSVSMSRDPSSSVYTAKYPTAQHPNQRILYIGYNVNYSLDSTGNRTNCLCQYKDNGSINGSYTFLGTTVPVSTNFDNSLPATFNGSQIIGWDHPGADPYIGPSGGPLSYSLNYSWTGTFSCKGTDGSSDSKKVSINGLAADSVVVPQEP